VIVKIELRPEGVFMYEGPDKPALKISDKVRSRLPDLRDGDVAYFEATREGSMVADLAERVSKPKDWP
jgi:hypothetical protein